jgi:hypothetical protein
MNSQVTQAEAKLGAILAAAGVLGGVLFTLIRGRDYSGVVFAAVAVLCAVSILTASLLAMIGLYPRFRSPRRARESRVTEPRFLS